MNLRHLSRSTSRYSVLAPIVGTPNVTVPADCFLLERSVPCPIMLGSPVLLSCLSSFAGDSGPEKTFANIPDMSSIAFSNSVLISEPS